MKVRDVVRLLNDDGGFAQQVIPTPKAIEFSRTNPLSFRPGFSQMNCAKLRSGKPSKRFGVSHSHRGFSPVVTQWILDMKNRFNGFPS